jgi:cell wall assembly regulator SMI1
MTWRPIEDQLRAQLPAALDRLNPPAGADDLRRFEAEVEAPLPEGFATAWGEHDGEALNEGDYLFPGLLHLPLAAMRGERDVMNALLATEYAGERNVAPAVGPVRPLYWSRQWIPFVQLYGASDFYCLDLDPPEGGRSGQVIRVSAKLDERTVVAPSVRAYLEDLAAKLRDGRILVVDGALRAAAPPGPLRASAHASSPITPAERTRFALGLTLAAVFWVALYFAFTRRTPAAIGAAVAAWGVWFVARRVMRRK